MSLQGTLVAGDPDVRIGGSGGSGNEPMDEIWTNDLVCNTSLECKGTSLFEGTVDVEGNRVICTREPTDVGDLCNKDYVDSRRRVHYCKLVRVAQFDIPSGTPTEVEWEVAENIDGMLVDTSSELKYIEASEAGMYLVGYEVSLHAGDARRYKTSLHPTFE